MAGVFCRNQVNFFEDTQRPEGDVFQVADGRGDNVERTGHVTGPSRGHTENHDQLCAERPWQ